MGLDEKIEVELNIECGCECEVSGVAHNATQCSGHGDLRCGVCECHSYGWQVGHLLNIQRSLLLLPDLIISFNFRIVFQLRLVEEPKQLTIDTFRVLDSYFFLFELYMFVLGCWSSRRRKSYTFCTLWQAPTNIMEQGLPAYFTDSICIEIWQALYKILWWIIVGLPQYWL